MNNNIPLAWRVGPANERNSPLMPRSHRIDLTTWMALAAHHEHKCIEEIESAAPQDASLHRQLKGVKLDYVRRCVCAAMMIIARLTRDNSWKEPVDNDALELGMGDGDSLKPEDLSLQNLEVDFPCPPWAAGLVSSQEAVDIQVNRDGCTMNGVLLDENQRLSVLDSYTKVEFVPPFDSIPLPKRQFTQSRHQFLRQFGLLLRLLFSRGKSAEGSSHCTDGSTKLIKRMALNDFDRDLLYAGVPVSLCRVVTDLMHSNSAKDDEGTSFQSLIDVFGELKEILLDRPQLLFDETDFEGSDASERGVDFGNVVHGRSYETSQVLQMAMLPNQWFKNRLVLIGGKGGTGKSFLVDSVKHTLETNSRWVSLVVKFDRLMQDSPLSAIANGFERFFASLLSSGDQAQYVASITASLQLALSRPMIALLGDLIPSVGRLFPDLMERVVSDDDLPSLVDRVGEDLNRYGRYDEIPSDPESTRNRLFYSFIRLVHAISSQGRPLMFVLDDLHWASKASLELVTSLMTEFDPLIWQQDQNNAPAIAPIGHILFVGLHRNDEVDEEHILSCMYSPRWNDAATLDVLSIQLQPLTKEACNLMISHALRLPVRMTQALSDIVHGKTLGNAFYVKVFVESLVINKSLYYSLSEKRWVWNMEKITTAPITESVAQLLIKSIKTLPLVTIWALKLLSCFGSSADESSLELLEDHIDMVGALEGAIACSIVEKHGQMYRFSHDLLEESVYSLMTTAEQSANHRLIGNVIIYKTDPQFWQALGGGRGGLGEHEVHFSLTLFIAVDQINRAALLEDDFYYSKRFATCNSKAAECSMGVSDFASAVSYANHGLSWLADQRWEDQNFAISLRLLETASKASFASLQFDKMRQYIDEIFEHTTHCLKDRFPTHLLLIESLGAIGKIDEMLVATYAILDELGETLPPDISPSMLSDEIVATKQLLKACTDNIDAKNAPRLVDWNRSARIRVLYTVGLFLFYPKIHHAAFFQCRIVKLSSEYGFCYASTLGLAFFANCLSSTDTEAANKWGKLSLALYNRLQSRDKHPILRCQIYLSFMFLCEPFQAVAEALRNSLEDAILAGDKYSASILFSGYSRVGLLCGNNLSDLKKECERYMTQSKQSDVRLRYFGVCLMVYQLSENHTFPSHLLPDVQLKSEEELLKRLEEKPIDLQDCHLNLLFVDFWYAEYDKAAGWAKMYREDISRRQSGFFTRVLDAFGIFYEGLTAFQMARKFPNEETWIEMGERSISSLERFVKHSAWNFDNKLRLLQAELLFFKGNKEAAIDEYKASIKSAKEHRFVHEEGVACELLGNIYAQGSEVEQAKLQLTCARECYEKWGAHGIVNVRAPVEKCTLHSQNSLEIPASSN